MSRPGVSRRDLFRGLFGQRQPKPARLQNTSAVRQPNADTLPVAPNFGRGVPLPLLRPPGAIEETAFLAACTRCDACIPACPHEAIGRASPRLRGAAGTPVLNPAQSPCRMCDDRPCIAACQTGALRFDVPAKMGTAMISPLTCLAYQNTTCSACVEQCPVEGAMRMENGRPVVDPAACTGCGVCQYVCPAPQNAVLILPAKNRPLPLTAEVRHDRTRE